MVAQSSDSHAQNAPEVQS